MSPDLTQQLLQRHPRLLSKLTARDEAAIDLICVDDSWFDLLDVLLERIQAHVETEELEQVMVKQVKEKLGTLRFYVNHGDEYIWGMTDMAVALSARLPQTTRTNS